MIMVNNSLHHPLPLIITLHYCNIKSLLIHNGNIVSTLWNFDDMLKEMGTLNSKSLCRFTHRCVTAQFLQKVA